jgi:NitT/TauT family transport system permease protein
LVSLLTRAPDADPGTDPGPSAEAIEAPRPRAEHVGRLVRARRRAGKVATRTVAIAAFLTAWEVLPRLELVDPTFVPPLSTVLQMWWKLASGGQLTLHAVTSVQRALTGFVLAIAIGVPLGLAIGWYRRIAKLLGPLLELFRNTAPLALLPVFIVILGIGEASKIWLIVYSCLWPILLNTISGVKGVDPLLIKSARSMALPQRRLFTKVILPAAVPTIFTGIRLAGAYSMLILIAAEINGAKAGLGYFISYSQYNFQIPQMYAGIITISIIGVGFNQLLVLLERRFSRWRATTAP